MEGENQPASKPKLRQKFEDIFAKRKEEQQRKKVLHAVQELQRTAGRSVLVPIMEFPITDNMPFTGDSKFIMTRHPVEQTTEIGTTRTYFAFSERGKFVSFTYGPKDKHGENKLTQQLDHIVNNEPAPFWGHAGGGGLFGTSPWAEEGEWRIPEEAYISVNEITPQDYLTGLDASVQASLSKDEQYQNPTLSSNYLQARQQLGNLLNQPAAL